MQFPNDMIVRSILGARPPCIHLGEYIEVQYHPLCIETLTFRLMDGVRRWITSGSPTARKSPHVEPWHAPASKASNQEIKVDKSSSEHIAAALLDPAVPLDEEREYGAYVEQCDELSRAPPNLAGRKDQRIYESTVLLSALGGDESLGDVKEKDLEVYGTYIEKGKPYTAEVVNEKETMPIVFDYGKWLTSGTSW